MIAITPMIRVSLLSLLAFSTGFSQEANFVTDAKWHFSHKLKSQWDKADATGDGIITIADKGGWWHNRLKDSNQDEKVTLEEFSTPLPLKNAAKSYYHVVYKEATGEKCLLDIYLPTKKRADKTPVFYFTHGGGWAAGTKDIKGNMATVFESMLAEGIACVSAAYRLVKKENSQSFMGDCVTDCKDGLRFIAKHADTLNLDINKVCVFGNSAGGHICLMLAYSPPESFPGEPSLQDYRVKPVAAINWYGPSSFLQGSLFTHPSVKDKPGNPNRFAGRMMPNGKAIEYVDAPAAQKRLMEKLSPVTYLKKDSAPVLTIHGDQDTTIPHMHSEHLLEKAKQIGANVTYLAVTNAGHGFNEKTNPPFEEINQTMVTFAVKQLFP